MGETLQQLADEVARIEARSFDLVRTLEGIAQDADAEYRKTPSDDTDARIRLLHTRQQAMDLVWQLKTAGQGA